MTQVDPATWTQLIVAAATLFTAIAGWLRSRSNSKKLDANTDLTADIHRVTNGPMQAHFEDLSAQASTNAAVARETAADAKVQAATDAEASKDKP